MEKHKLLLVLLILICKGCCVEACVNSTVTERLTAALLSEYEMEQRPYSGAGGAPAPGAAPAPEPTAVALALVVRHARVDEVRSTCVVIADLYMSWLDPRLAWNSSQWGTAAAYMSPDAIWRPDLSLLNAAEFSGSDEDVQVALAADGSTLWVPRLQLTAPSTLDLQAWPSDEQTCALEMGSRTYSSSELELLFESFKQEDGIEIPAGNWASTVIASELKHLKREGVSYQAVRWVVRLRRRGGAHAVTARVISTAVLMLLLASLLTPPAERATLHVAAALSSMIQLAIGTSRLPPGVNTPRLLRLHASLLGLAAVSALCSAGVARAAALRVRPSSPRVRRLLTRAAFLAGYREQTSTTETDEVAEDEDSGYRLWEGVARALDILLSCVTLLVVVILLACFA